MSAPVLDSVQANVLRPADPGFLHASFHFLRLHDRRAGRELVGDLLDSGLTVSDAAGRAARGGRRCQVVVGFTRQGLGKLGLYYRPHPTQVFDEHDPFEQGMQARSRLLRDPDTSRWRGSGCNMLLWSAYGDRPDRQGEVRDLIRRPGVEQLTVESGTYAGDPPLLLGFRDGTSQPFLSELASSRTGLAGGGTPTPDGWRPVRMGEFVFGSTDNGEERLIPRPTWFTIGGTFLVFRKYAVHESAVASFWRAAGQVYEDTLGVRAGRGRHMVAAKVMGRFEHGREPAGWPPGHDALYRTNSLGPGLPASANDFRYARDTYGHACPLGAHVRRANPRDALGYDGELTHRHRIVRRGIPWRTTRESGLHFVAVNARIDDQFEFIQRQWLNSGTAFRLGSDDVDLVAGAWPPRRTTAPFVIQGPEPVTVDAPRPFVELRGGDYFLLPGMEGLRTLSGRWQ